MARPACLVVVTGTGTEIGKTWVAVGLLGCLRRRGRRVGARKPAQSFAAHSAEPSDAQRLAAATGEAAELICPPHRSYPAAMAPPMAADALRLPPFTIGDLVGEIGGSWPSPAPDVGVVEGAGGVAAPQADDGDTVALIDALAPDVVVVVAPAGLGTINLVRLCATALSPKLGGAFPHMPGKAPPSSPPAGRGASRRLIFHLNHWDDHDDLHRANRRWLTERDGFAVTTSIGALADLVVRTPGGA